MPSSTQDNNYQQQVDLCPFNQGWIGGFSLLFSYRKHSFESFGWITSGPQVAWDTTHCRPTHSGAPCLEAQKAHPLTILRFKFSCLNDVGESDISDVSNLVGGPGAPTQDLGLRCCAMRVRGVR